MLKKIIALLVLISSLCFPVLVQAAPITLTVFSGQPVSTISGVGKTFTGLNVTSIYFSATNQDLKFALYNKSGAQVYNGSLNKGQNQTYTVNLANVTSAKVFTYYDGMGTGQGTLTLYGNNENNEKDRFVIKDLMASTNEDTNVTTLKWAAIDSVFFDHFEVYLNGQKVGDTKGNSYVFPNLDVGKEYMFKVVSYDIDKAEFPGGEIKYKVPLPDNTPPDKPVLNGAVTGTTVKLTWSKNTSKKLAGYVVFQDGVKVATLAADVQNYTINGLAYEKKYDFTVTAYDTKNNMSDPSDPFTVEIKKAVTDSDQEAKPDYLLIKWTETPGAVGYIVYLNGKEVGTTGPEAREFKITKEMGYNPNILSKGLVKPKLADGSVGGGNNDTGGYEKPSFGPNDIWTNVMVIVSSMAGFLLLGIVIRFAPRIFRLVKESIQSYRGNTY